MTTSASTRDGLKDIPVRLTPMGTWARTSVAYLQQGDTVSFAALRADGAAIETGAETADGPVSGRGSNRACWLLVEVAEAPAVEAVVTELAVARTRRRA